MFTEFGKTGVCIANCEIIIKQIKVKIAIQRDGKSPDLKVNDKQLQTANLVYIFDEMILSVTASKYGR